MRSRVKVSMRFYFTVLGLLEGVDHSIEVESSGLGVVVGVLDELESSILDDLVVVSPGWLADIDIGWAMGSDELECESQGTGSGEGLSGDDLFE